MNGNQANHPSKFGNAGRQGSMHPLCEIWQNSCPFYRICARTTRTRGRYLSSTTAGPPLHNPTSPFDAFNGTDFPEQTKVRSREILSGQYLCLGSRTNKGCLKGVGHSRLLLLIEGSFLILFRGLRPCLYEQQCLPKCLARRDIVLFTKAG